MVSNTFFTAAIVLAASSRVSAHVSKTFYRVSFVLTDANTHIARHLGSKHVGFQQQPGAAPCPRSTHGYDFRGVVVGRYQFVFIMSCKHSDIP